MQSTDTTADLNDLARRIEQVSARPATDDNRNDMLQYLMQQYEDLQSHGVTFAIAS